MTVLDLTQQLPGPFATALLGGLGARVIKIEPPTGDPSRDLDAQMFARANAGKQSVVLDLKSDWGRAALQRLVLHADVLVESFRPGVMTRLGSDWTTCGQTNPRLVYCSVSGFGSAGPYAQVPVHDMNLMAWADPAGARATSGRIGVPWIDLGTGTTAALLIVSAWVAANRTGQGGPIEVSMQDVAMSWSRVKPPLAALQPTYGVFKTRDHKEVVIAILEDHFWSRLCEALGFTAFAQDPELRSYAGRLAHAEVIQSALSQRILELSLDQIFALARSHDFPLTSVSPSDDALALEHLAANGHADGTFRLPASATPEPTMSVPSCGEHTAQVLAEAGISPETLR